MFAYLPVLLSGEADAVVAAMQVKPSLARRAAIKALISAGKNSGWWQRHDNFYNLAAHDAQAARLNWKAPHQFSLSLVDAPTFTADQGYQMDASNDALDTGWNPAKGPNYERNDASYWLWSRTTGQSNNFDIGGTTSSLLSCGIVRSTSNLMSGRVNDATTSSSSTTHTDGSGLFMWRRPDSATKNFWINGVQLGTDLAVASTGVTAINSLHIGAAAGSTFGGRQIAAGGWGGALSTGQMTAHYAAMLAYMQAVGAA